MSHRITILFSTLLLLLLSVVWGAAPAALRVTFGVVGVEDPEGRGLIVTRLVRLSPAEKAGVRPTDMLLNVAGKPVPTRPALVDALADKNPGDEVPVILLRDGREKRLTVTLGERAPGDPAASRAADPISAEKMAFIIECQKRLARTLSGEKPDTRLLLELGAQIRTATGGLAGAGSTTLRYTDAQGMITLTVTPAAVDVEAGGIHYSVTAGQEASALPAELRARLYRLSQP